MERINFDYSIKNIPLANERNYKMKLIERIEDVIKRMRWKAIWFMARNKDTSTPIETYCLKSKHCPKQVKRTVTTSEGYKIQKSFK